MRTHVVLSLILFSSSAFAQCQTPQYQTGAKFADSKSTFVASIVLSLKDLSPTRLACLAKSLRGRYSDRQTIVVSIFTSRESARESLFGQEYTKEQLQAFAAMHARYTLDHDKHEEYIEIMPLGVTPSLRAAPGSTRIDLPLSSDAHCELEITNRCLMALTALDYPNESLKHRRSASITLGGTITMDGTIRGAHIVKVGLGQEQGKNLLARTALSNFSSWQLEPGLQDNPIQIAFTYLLDDSLPRTDPVQIDWRLPTEVRIKGRPSE